MNKLTSVILLSLFFFTSCFTAGRDNPADKNSDNHRDQNIKTITASDGDYIDKVEITWDMFTEGVEYKIYRSDSEEGSYTLLATTTETTYEDTNIETQKKYYYWIKIENTTAQYQPDSGYSGALYIPTQVAASENQVDKIVVTWGEVEHADSYSIYRSTEEAGEYTLVKTTTETSYEDATVEAGTLYFYKIKSYDEQMNIYSDYSDSAYGFSRDLYTTESVTVSQRLVNKIIVYWTTIDEATEYYIYRSESADGEYIPIAKTESTSYEDTKVVAGTTYYYKIRTYSLALDTYSQLSSSGSGFSCLPLAIPENITATQGAYADKVKLDWNAVDGVASYNIYRSTDKTTGYLFVGNTTNLTYEDSTGQAGTFYYYKVEAYSSCLVQSSDLSAYAKGISIARMTSPAAGIEMRKIPAVTYYRGQEGISGAEPVHQVTLANSFYIGKYEVTWQEWQLVRSWAYANGYTFSEPSSPGVGIGGSDGAGGNTHPVTSISWYDAIKWCNALSQYEGKTPVYYTDFTKGTVYKTGEIALDSSCVNWSANGYRLPTEAEWEWAARAGTTTAFYWGEDLSYSVINLYAWYFDNSSDLAQIVGQKLPNSFNLYDMTGNVREWCWDRHDTYNANSQTDPTGPDVGTNRILRGGGFKHHTSSLYLPIRENQSPTYKYNSFGLRVVLQGE